MLKLSVSYVKTSSPSQPNAKLTKFSSAPLAEKIPTTAIIGCQECLKKCGIDAKSFDISKVGLSLSHPKKQP
jgi:hypothetical protein